jgi:hypothetical protein
MNWPYWETHAAAECTGNNIYTGEGVFAFSKLLILQFVAQTMLSVCKPLLNPLVFYANI